MNAKRVLNTLRAVPPPVWYLLAGVGVYFALRHKAGQAARQVLEAPARVGEAASEKLFAILNPSLSKPAPPTIVEPSEKSASGKCPPGYKLTYGRAAGWYCLRVE